MSSDPSNNAALDPGFFDGRLLVDILEWDWNLRLTLSSEPTRPKARFQGGLDYGRDFKIKGRIRAPREVRGKAITITLSPFGPKVRFGKGGLKAVGQLRCEPPCADDSSFTATVLLPESAIPSVAVSLAFIWKHLDIWTFGETDEGAEISAFSFSASIHPNLADWADGR